MIKVLGRVEKKLVFCGSKMLELFFSFCSRNDFYLFLNIIPYNVSLVSMIFENLKVTIVNSLVRLGSMYFLKMLFCKLLA